jgi:medium-chain acyl-[acyl-carrier-protein] hydrolase
MFNIWKRSLPAFIEVCPILLPGREGRLSEPSCIDSETLIAHITAALAGHMDKPYAIFGHSMGALLALELAQSLRSSGLREPGYLFVSGRNASHLPLAQRFLHQLPDDQFLAELETRYGGIPQEILTMPEMLELYLPILRADLTLLETHLHRDRLPLNCPIAAFAGRDDRNVSPAGIEAWGEHTTAGFETRWFEGGHFYLSGASRTALLSLIGERLTLLDAANSPELQSLGTCDGEE